MRRWPKLSAVCDTETHLFVSARVTRGPRNDKCEAPPILRRAKRRTRFGRALLDAGYDSEGMHELVRDEPDAESVIPPKSGPRTRWRKVPPPALLNAAEMLATPTGFEPVLRG